MARSGPLAPLAPLAPLRELRRSRSTLRAFLRDGRRFMYDEGELLTTWFRRPVSPTDLKTMRWVLTYGPASARRFLEGAWSTDNPRILADRARVLTLLHDRV